MARHIRLQYSNALYHVWNRGNYRAAIFATPGARIAFVLCLAEAAERYGWIVHAYILMNNHFHIALETPRANLSEGLHWLETTYATRFNRFRGEHGHLFQGRFKAILVQAGTHLACLVNYIHLNPVAAELVSLEGLPGYQWSSLPGFLRRERPPYLACAEWLKELGFQDSPAGWRAYQDFLAKLARDPKRQIEAGFDCMTKGWAIGADDWRTEIATQFRKLPMLEAPYGPERDAIREILWKESLEEILKRTGHTLEEAELAPKCAAWKVAIADELRRTTTATNRWLGRTLSMGKASTVRCYLHLARKKTQRRPKSP